MVKNLPATAGDVGEMSLIPGLGRSPEEANGNPLQCSCLVNLMDREAWWAAVHGVTKKDMTEPLSMHPTHYQGKYLSCKGREAQLSPSPIVHANTSQPNLHKNLKSKA